MLAAEVRDDDDSMIFEDLASELASPVVNKEELWSLPHRPGYHVRYKHIADYGEVEKALKRSDRARRRNSRPGEVDIDAMKSASIMLANHMTGIVRQGREWTVDGKPVTVRSKALLDALGCTNAADAVVKMYGWDADVLNHGNRLTDASGFGRAGDDDEDPTLDD